MSSPYNSQSNGKAENSIKIAKRLFKRSADPYMALLEWWNTPTIGMGSTPCQRPFSRRTRGAIVTSDHMLQPGIRNDMWGRKIARQQVIQAQGCVRERRELPPLQLGKPVLDVRAKKTQWSRGRCLDQLSDRSYIVDVDGEILRRNRRFLKPSAHRPMGHEETSEGTVNERMVPQQIVKKQEDKFLKRYM